MGRLVAEPGLVALVPFLVQDSSVRRKILETQLRYTQQKWAPFSEEVQGVFGALLAPVSSRVGQGATDTPPKVGA